MPDRPEPGEQLGWSAPSLYSGGQPLAAQWEAQQQAQWQAQWQDAAPWEAAERDAARDVPWGEPTYVGPRRWRPGQGRACQPGAGEPRTADGDRGLIANSRTMAIATLVSRVTGFVRNVLLVAALGLGAVGNSYSGGDTFPNMVYELLLGGVLSSVLIPLLVKAQEEDADDGVAYTQRLLSIAAAALAALTAIAVACAPLIAGYFAEPSERSLTTVFAWLLLPEIFFYGLGAMFMAVLNVRHVYGPGAWAPVLNNVVVIVAVGVFWILPGPDVLTPATITTPQILVVGIGTTLGIAVQAFALIPALRRSGFSWRWRFRGTPQDAGRLREMGTLAGWVFGYVVASQVGVAVIQKVGFRNGGLSIFTRADLLFQMPYGILVVSLLTAIMPRLSRAAVRGDNPAVVSDFALGSRLTVLAMLPVTAGLIVLGPDLGVVLFGHGQATVAHARVLGQALALSAFGLVFFAVVMLQLRVFYAMRDGRTPTLVNVVVVAVKVAVVLISFAAFGFPTATKADPLPSAGAAQWLNIATSLSFVVGAVLGHVLLERRLGHLGYRPVAATAVRMLGASVLGGGAAYAVVRGAHGAFGTGHAGATAGLVGGAVVGLAVLGAVCWALRFPEVAEIRALARR